MTAFLQALGAGEAWLPNAGDGAPATRRLAAGKTLAVPVGQSSDGRA